MKNLRVAAYLIALRGDRVLLSKRCNTGWGDGEFSLVAGHVEFDESPTTAMVREAKEEAGLVIKESDLECVQVVHRRCREDLVYIDYFFQLTTDCGEPVNMEPEKCSALAWYSLQALPTEIIGYVKEILLRVTQGKQQRGLLEYGWNEQVR